MKFDIITKMFPFCILLIAITSCEKDKIALVIPDSYDGAAYTTNAAPEIALRTSLANFSSEMKKGRTTGVKVDFVTLTQLYQAGSPSLVSITTDYYKNRIEGSGGWMEELSKASGNSYTPGVPQGDGGVFISNLFDENGLELEQVIEKGLFAAAMYHHAANLMDGQLDATVTDRLVALFGAHPDFPNSDNSSLTNPDKFAAQYAARRDKNDGQGLYTTIRDAFIKLQTAIAAGGDYQREQQEAVATIQNSWEKIILATAVNYFHSTISKLSSTNPSDADQASALHAYSEAVGFIHGWRTISQENKIITDEEIEGLLTLLNAPYDGTATSYLFVTDPVNELPKLSEAISTIQSIYGFTDQEIQDFKENWVLKQGR